MVSDQMLVEPLDKEFFAKLSDHWIGLKDYLLEHDPGADLKTDYASLIDRVGKVNEGISLEYRVVKDVMKKLQKLMSKD